MSRISLDNLAVITLLLQDNDLRKKCKAEGLSTRGDRRALISRHQRFTLLYNSECHLYNPRWSKHHFGPHFKTSLLYIFLSKKALRYEDERRITGTMKMCIVFSQPPPPHPPSPTATAPYFYGSVLLRALKSEIIVILTYVHKK
jgi:hypothetical protein